MKIKRILILLAGMLVSVHAAAAPDLILLKNYHPGMDIRGWLMSEKLDGVRAYWNGRALVSRQGNHIDAPGWFTRGFPDFELDGELWMGRRHFEQTASAIASGRNHPGWQRLGYYIFELPHASGNLRKRLDKLRQYLKTAATPQLHLIKQQICADAAMLQRRLKVVEKQGGEGLVLRNPDANYETGRSYHALKVKNFDDMEARVIGYRAGQGKYRGMTGALQVELDNGKQFYIGSGLSDEQRRTPPPIGSNITFKYSGFTRNGIPRFASFMRIRHR